MVARFVQAMYVGRGRKDRGFIPPVANPKDHFHPPSKKKESPSDSTDDSEGQNCSPLPFALGDLPSLPPIA